MYTDDDENDENDDDNEDDHDHEVQRQIPNMSMSTRSKTKQIFLCRPTHFSLWPTVFTPRSQLVLATTVYC